MITTNVYASLSYRCEHQANQNAVQFPLDAYFYITYDAPLLFKKYEILFYQNNKLNSILEYANGETRELLFANQKVVATSWEKFGKKIVAFKKEVDPYLSFDDKNLELTQNLNIDFVTKINKLAVFHSIELSEDKKRKKDEVSFLYIRPDTEIELKTDLPGNKVDYRVANKGIAFNKKTGMLMQVDLKINTAFLSYLFVCRSWDLNKIPTNYVRSNLKKEDGARAQFSLLEDDLSGVYGQFSKIVYDIVFKAVVNYYLNSKENNDKEQRYKIKIIHALVKSEILKDYILELTRENILRDEIKKQLLIYSHHSLTSNYANLDTNILAATYKDMYEILVSYSELLKKGY